MQGNGQAAAIDTLIELMEDINEDVRDWATFALGSQCDVDFVEVREALRKRLDDPFEDARSEAVWGLARRKDPLGLQILLERLESETRLEGDEMSAAELLDVPYDTSREKLKIGLRKLLSKDKLD